MADELDAELLGMVGGSDDESGDEDYEHDQTQVLDDRSPSVEPHASVEKVDEPERKKGVAQKVKGRRGKRKTRRESEDEDDAVSLSPPGSPGGSAIDQYDGEADAPGEEEDEDAPLFPLEGKFTSVADREHVLSLGELEREEILADRAHQVITRQQDLQLRKALANSNAANKAKRKAAAADLDDSNKRSTRPRVEKRTALDDYREARERKGAERGRVAPTRDRRDDRSPSSRGSDADADGESEVEWADRPERKDEQPAELKDFDRCRVGRSNFAKVCFYPGFEDAIKGCFTRVSIGMNRQTGQNTYRMTQIKDFTIGKPYQMENASGKHFTTDQYAIVVQGTSEKPWPFSACSDGRFTDAEFSRYIDTLKKENLRVPAKEILSKKVDDINKLLQTNFTEETLQLKFAKQKSIQLKYDPVHQAKVKRKEIERRRTMAATKMDEEEVARCDSELEALENGASNGVSVKIKQSPAKPMTQHERLALLNHKNRAKNQQEVRQALIEERKKIMKARETEAARKMEEVRAKVHAKAAARRQSNMELFGEGTPNGSRAGTPLNGVGTPKKRVGAPDEDEDVQEGPVGAIHRKPMDDEIIGALDLGIDIEI